MNRRKKMKWISLVATAALACALLAGCGPTDAPANTDPATSAPVSEEPTPAAVDAYHLVGETLVQQTGADDSYRCGELDLNADGTAVFTLLTRAADSEEKTVMYTWSQGTWTKNDDDTVSIVFDTLPDDGGHGEFEGVETQVSLEEGELTAEPNGDGKLTVEISVQTDLITYAIQQYTAIEMVAE